MYVMNEQGHKELHGGLTFKVVLYDSVQMEGHKTSGKGQNDSYPNLIK